MWNWINPSTEVSELSNLTSAFKSSLSVDDLSKYNISPLTMLFYYVYYINWLKPGGTEKNDFYTKTVLDDFLNNTDSNNTIGWDKYIILG